MKSTVRPRISNRTRVIQNNTDCTQAYHSKTLLFIRKMNAMRYIHQNSFEAN